MLSKARRLVLTIINKNDLLVLLGMVGVVMGLILSPYNISALVLTVLAVALVLDRWMKAPSFAFFWGSFSIMVCFAAPAYAASYIR